MDREFLQGLKLEDGVIEKIMAEYGKSVQKYKDNENTIETQKTEIGNLNTQIKKANKKIADFEEMDIEAIKQEVNDYKQKYEKAQADNKIALDKMHMDYELDKVLSGAKARNTKAVKALLDSDKIKLENGKLTGIDEQLKLIKKDNDYLFESENNGKSSGNFKGVKPAGSENHQGGNDDVGATYAQQFNARFGVSENQQ